jgi:uncharacterized protein involved in exopolysaccharide biosynthesis
MQGEDLLVVNFRALLKVIWQEKIGILLCVVLFTIVGSFYAFSLKEEFISQGKILPEAQSKAGGLGQFSGLAALAGVDLGSTGSSGIDAIRPDLYPNVITSTPFYLELLKAKVKTKENKELSFESYYHEAIEDGKAPEEKVLYKFPIEQEGIIVVNRLNEKRLKDLQTRITSSIDKKTGVISISTKMPDPVVAADVSKFAMHYLMEYIKNYRTEKLRQDVDYLAEQVSTSRGKYYSTQQKKASYSDQFQAGSIRLQSADVQRERIESEYRLSSSFYNELLKKYEESKFKLHQETPVFQILEPPVVPNLKSEPKRSIMLLGFAFLGSILGFVYAILKSSNYKKIISEQY